MFHTSSTMFCYFNKGTKIFYRRVQGRVKHGRGILNPIVCLCLIIAELKYIRLLLLPCAEGRHLQSALGTYTMLTIVNVSVKETPC